MPSSLLQDQDHSLFAGCDVWISLYLIIWGLQEFKETHPTFLIQNTTVGRR